jgi:hypothetical protein
MFVVLLAVAVFAYVASQWKYGVPDQRPGLRISSVAYQWTAACPPEHEAKDEVMRGCLREEYRIADPAAAGLTDRIRRRQSWYRIGDDAVLVTCWSWGTCTEDVKVADRFTR